VTSSFDFYDKPGYLQEITQAANEAGIGDELIYMAMGYDASIPEIAEMTDALSSAASRGAKASLIIDAYCFTLNNSEHLGPMFTRGKIVPKYLRGTFRQTYEKLESFKSNGGTYHIINRPKHAFEFPYSGRSHIKLAIINDRFFIGGCNFDAVTNLDIMVAWNNAPTATILKDILRSIVGKSSVKEALDYTDQTLMLGDYMQLLIDCGVKKQSTILRNAFEVIDNAKEHIVMTCQYFPGRNTAQHLLAAHKRGVDVKIYFSHPSVHGPLSFVHQLYNWREQLGLPSSFFDHQLAKSVPKLHSKVLISESAAMIGSHNYVRDGVNYGTAEIALLNYDPEFIANLSDKVDDLVSGRPLVRNIRNKAAKH
jgi:phosphatidylserine/phosphatidylglycerophosphate/cardiolipin synthase-like enzyme